MKKIRFYLYAGSIHGKAEEIVEFEDDAEAEEIQEVFDDWLGNFDMGWHDVEEDED